MTSKSNLSIFPSLQTIISNLIKYQPEKPMEMVLLKPEKLIKELLLLMVILKEVLLPLLLKINSQKALFNALLLNKIWSVLPKVLLVEEN